MQNSRSLHVRIGPCATALLLSQESSTGLPYQRLPESPASRSPSSWSGTPPRAQGAAPERCLHAYQNTLHIPCNVPAHSGSRGKPCRTFPALCHKTACRIIVCMLLENKISQCSPLIPSGITLREAFGSFKCFSMRLYSAAPANERLSATATIWSRSKFSTSLRRSRAFSKLGLLPRTGASPASDCMTDSDA